VQQSGSFKFFVNIELLTDQSGGELLRPASTSGLRKAVRGTIVKTTTAPASQPTVENPAPLRTQVSPRKIVGDRMYKIRQD